MLILASQSAARQSLLAGAGLKFESSPALIDERALEAAGLGKPSEAVARALAEAKALSVSALRPPTG
jgi:septum formation protein